LWYWPEATRAAGAVLERLFAHTATAQWLLTLPPESVTHMVGELVKLVDCPNEIARTAALRVLSNLAVAAPQVRVDARVCVQGER